MTQAFQGSFGRWAAFIGRRLAGAVLAMLGVVVIVFVVTHVLGDPARLILGPRATAEQVDELRHQLGYDQSLPAQFFSYLGDLLRGDLGVSQYTQQPVTEDLRLRFPATLELAGAAMMLGLVWTIPLGVISALRPRGVADRISQVIV